MDEYLEVWKKYADFQGRASRREYWMFFGVNLLFLIVLGIFEGIMGTKFLGLLYALAICIPSLAVGVRRLHDTNRSGWWLLLCLIPLIGTLVLIVFALQGSQNEGNRYGDVSERTRIANQTLADFIQQSRAAGQTDEQIKIALLEKGWSYADIESVLKGDAE
jgi:uncharacterized membrane protein YhaH (DUF805 family)